uniref:Uncharacterized protein n=1 Tax=Timema monikensis TaxID=170555 RepID=A0A7R9EAY2_9NEOP|nr:unnamed protein product [Timema monikensis]
MLTTDWIGRMRFGPWPNALGVVFHKEVENEVIGLFSEHLLFLLALVQQSNNPSNVYVRFMAANCLTEVELNFPRILRECINNLYSLSLIETSVAHQQYMCLLALTVKNSVASESLETLWGKFPKVHFKDKLHQVDETELTIADINQMVSFLLDQLVLCTKEGSFWIICLVMEMMRSRADLQLSVQVLKPILIHNLRVYNPQSFHEHLKSVTDNEVCSLLNLGTCGLHVVHGSLRTGVESVDWDISSLLRHMYYLFTDSPARRALFTQLTGCTTFPLKFCGVRWLENAKCFQRALQIWDHVIKFLKEAKLPKTKPVETLKRAACDPLLKCKLAFCKTLADEYQPFLQRFQTSKPMTPNLFEAVEKLLRYLMNHCVKPDLMKCTGETTITVTERQKLEFIHECRRILTTMIAKLQERSPLKQKSVRGLSSLDPCVIQHSPQLGQKRFSFLLEELNHANIINDVLAENVKKEYLHFCNLKKSQLQEIFRPCDQFSDENHFGSMLFEEKDRTELLNQTLVNATHPSLPACLKLLYLDWAGSYFQGDTPQTSHITKLFPGLFDGPETQLKKLHILSGFLKNKSGGLTSSVVMAVKVEMIIYHTIIKLLSLIF